MTVKKCLVLVLLLTLVLALAVGCGNGEAEPSEPGNNDEPNDAVLTAEELVEQRCASCHNLDRVLRERDEGLWPGIVTNMVNRSPGLLNDEEYTLVVEYLQENYGR